MAKLTYETLYDAKGNRVAVTKRMRRRRRFIGILSG